MHLHVELALAVTRHPDRPRLEVQVEAEERNPPRDVTADQVRYHLEEDTKENRKTKRKR